MTEQTQPQPGVPATTRPSPDVIDRGLRHLRQGIMGFRSMVTGAFALPSGNGGPAHTVTRQADTLTCSCKAGQNGQACWAVAIYQMVSGLAVQWDEEPAPTYRPVDTHEEDGELPPVEAPPTRKSDLFRPEKPAPAEPATPRLTTAQKTAAQEVYAELNEQDLVEPTNGRKIAWFGRSGYGVRIQKLAFLNDHFGEEAARQTVQAAIAQTVAKGSAHCGGCGDELSPFSSGKHLACWECGIVIPNPAAEEETAA